jgi:hypothetical protein
MGCGTSAILNRVDAHGQTPLMHALHCEKYSYAAWRLLVAHPLVDVTIRPPVPPSDLSLVGSALDRALATNGRDDAVLAILMRFNDSQLLHMITTDLASGQCCVLVRAARRSSLVFKMIWNRLIPLITTSRSCNRKSRFAARPTEKTPENATTSGADSSGGRLLNWAADDSRPSFCRLDADTTDNRQDCKSDNADKFGEEESGGGLLQELLCSRSPRGLTVFTAACDIGENWRTLFTNLQTMDVPDDARYGVGADGKRIRYPLTTWPWLPRPNPAVVAAIRSGRPPPRAKLWSRWLLWRFHEPVRFCMFPCPDQNEPLAEWLVENCVPDFALNEYDCGGQTMLMRAATAEPPLPRLIRALISRIPALDPLQLDNNPLLGWEIPPAEITPVGWPRVSRFSRFTAVQYAATNEQPVRVLLDAAAQYRRVYLVPMTALITLVLSPPAPASLIHLLAAFVNANGPYRADRGGGRQRRRQKKTAPGPPVAIAPGPVAIGDVQSTHAHVMPPDSDSFTRDAVLESLMRALKPCDLVPPLSEAGRSLVRAMHTHIAKIWTTPPPHLAGASSPLSEGKPSSSLGATPFGQWLTAVAFWPRELAALVCAYLYLGFRWPPSEETRSEPQ